MTVEPRTCRPVADMNPKGATWLSVTFSDPLRPPQITEPACHPFPIRASLLGAAAGHDRWRTSMVRLKWDLNRWPFGLGRLRSSVAGNNLSGEGGAKLVITAAQRQKMQSHICSAWESAASEGESSCCSATQFVYDWSNCRGDVCGRTCGRYEQLDCPTLHLWPLTWTPELKVGLQISWIFLDQQLNTLTIDSRLFINN